MQPISGKIVLMGSGELTATMVTLHKELLSQVGVSPMAVFVDTPAGFQPNVDQISDRAQRYFKTRIGHRLQVASFKQAGDDVQHEQTCQRLRKADYVLIGPGSPAYALRQWRSSRIPSVLSDHIKSGGCLVAASAAALTLGTHTLPVYEIYKVGHDPQWEQGINLLAEFGLDLVVMPHWNNAEGGSHDTRFCFMGASRFAALESQLEPDTVILGIDEHTACVIDFAKGRFSVRGIGRVVVRVHGREQVFSGPESYSVDLLRGVQVDQTPPERPATPVDRTRSAPQFWERINDLSATFESALTQSDAQTATNALLATDRAIWDAQAGSEDESAVSQARDALREMIVTLGGRLVDAPPDRSDCLKPVVEAFLALRDTLRAEKNWDAADQIRDALQSAGILIEDTRRQSRWYLRRSD